MAHSQAPLQSHKNDQLPPSNPPSKSSDFDASSVQEDLTSEEIPLCDIISQQDYTPDYNFTTPLHCLHRSQHSSSLPAEAMSPMLSHNDILVTPRTQHKLNYSVGQEKRRATLARKQQESLADIREESEALFRVLLRKLKDGGCSMAEFLDYVYNPAHNHGYDWCWKGFFKDRMTMKHVLGYWTMSPYSKTTRVFIRDWALEQVGKAAAQETVAITKSGILMKSKKTVNEEFFLRYSLVNLTQLLCLLAPTFFAIVDAFSNDFTTGSSINT
ncbi:hypothetical protein C0991_012399 [Blastosporella zonata]|nr:hypothetical protein C0991_012399 [Blastosporella zonata]